MRRLVAALPLLALSLAGCSTKGLNILAPESTRTPQARVNAVATAEAPSVAHTGFDSYAGNCPDAVGEDTALIDYAGSQNYTFDIQLQIKPTAGCDADPKSPSYKIFLRQVTQATLTLNALDTAWVYGYVSTRDTFLTNVFSQLQAHYPSLSNATIAVNYGGNTRATLTYTGHGAPAVNDLYAQ